jgi:hypothetical protein
VEADVDRYVQTLSNGSAVVWRGWALIDRPSVVMRAHCTHWYEEKRAIGNWAGKGKTIAVTGQVGMSPSCPVTAMVFPYN